MRPSNKSRSRNKSGNLGPNPNSNSNNNNNNNRQRLGNIINRVFESAGPEGKVRGTPQQIIDKYQALARDAQLSGDRVAAESFLQHSEHYSRMLGEALAAQNEARQSFERDEAGREGRDEARREDVRRDDPLRGPGFGDQPRRPDGQPFPPRRDQRPSQPAVASALDTIDTVDDFGGLIETPESAGAPTQPEAAPRLAPAEAEPAGALNGAHHMAAGEAAPAEGPKRSRPRRRAPRPEGEPAEATGE
jgi:hypothetical protein